MICKLRKNRSTIQFITEHLWAEYFFSNGLIAKADCISAESKIVYSDLNNLQDLRLDHNDIDSVSNSTFSGLSHLVNLTLSNNKLKTLPEEAFEELSHLKMLDLSENQLISFLPDHLISLIRLEWEFQINLTSLFVLIIFVFLTVDLCTIFHYLLSKSERGAGMAFFSIFGLVFLSFK